jgi:hypothetical protein
VDSILKDLYIENVLGLDTVNVDDSLDPTAERQVYLGEYFPAAPAQPPLDDTDPFGSILGLTDSGAGIYYEYNDTSSVTVQTSGGDTVHVMTTSVTTNLVGTSPLDDRDQTDTTVIVGNRGSLAGINGDLNIENPTFLTDVIVDDVLDTSAPVPTFTLSTLGTNPADFPSNVVDDSSTDQWGELNGLPTGARINYEYNDTASLTLKTGAGATVDFSDTQSFVTTTLEGNNNSSGTANIYGNTGRLTVQSYASVNVAQYGLVDNINGGIDATNDAAVSVDDSVDWIAQTVTITPTTVSGFPGSNSSSWLTYSGLNSLTIHAGTPRINGVPTGAGNLFYVQGTAPMPAGTPSVPGGTILYGGQGPDTFDVGSSTNTLDPIQGVLSIYGNNPNTTLNVHDDTTGSNEFYSVNFTQVLRTLWVPGQPLGNPTQTINFFNLGSVHVCGGTAADLFGVPGTLPGTSVALYGGPTLAGGYNEFIVTNAADTLDDIRGPVAIHGGSRRDLAYANDGLNTVGHTYTLRATDVQRVDDNRADITYDGLGEFILATGDNPYSGHNPPSTVNVLSTAPNAFTVVATGAGDTVNLGMPIPNTTFKTLENFQGPVRVQLGEYHLGGGQVVVDDSGDPNARQVT